MVGQQKKRDDSLNTVTSQEFFARYPTLRPFLLKQLMGDEAVSEGSASEGGAGKGKASTRIECE